MRTSPMLSGSRLAAYHRHITGPHDFAIEVDVLDMEERLKGPLRTQFTDGQVNIQRDGLVKRTASLTFYDPDHSLHLDNESPFAGAMFADRMIRVTHIVDVPGIGVVSAVVFVGPVVKVTREGDKLTVECQDKTLLAVEGSEAFTVRKGLNAVDAIERIMRQCTGETRFRFPQGHKARLARPYTVGWTPESSPWVICQKIAASINMQLVYACDGRLLLRTKPTSAVFVFAEGASLTSIPRADYDMTKARNIVRVTGERPAKKRGANTPAPKKKPKPERFTKVARAKAGHPMSAQRLGRNGVPRYLPLLIDDSGIKKDKVAQARANRALAEALPMGIAASFAGIPIFHLDYGDPVRISSDYGDAVVPFVEGSIPLGLGGDATVGVQRRVKRWGRR